jgi:imidazole glycerol-phosphate synthase subunit HisF
MSLTKRIIPCLDVKNNLVVKGINFQNLEILGDPVKIAKKYYDEGADEIVFLDISATDDKRKTMIDWIKMIAKEIFIPFTVGGGISDIDQINNLLRAGADKVAINTAAILDPDFIQKASDRFGAQTIVVAIDVKRSGQSWKVYSHAGSIDTGIDIFDWVNQLQELGAGEILLTSIDRDGTYLGYDIDLLTKVSKMLSIPVIASGGGGDLRSFAEVLATEVSAVLAASIFHYEETSFIDLKKYLSSQNINVRL